MIQELHSRIEKYNCQFWKWSRCSKIKEQVNTSGIKMSESHIEDLGWKYRFQENSLVSKEIIVVFCKAVDGETLWKREAVFHGFHRHGKIGLSEEDAWEITGEKMFDRRWYGRRKEPGPVFTKDLGLFCDFVSDLRFSHISKLMLAIEWTCKSL